MDIKKIVVRIQINQNGMITGGNKVHLAWIAVTFFRELNLCLRANQGRPWDAELRG